MDACVRSQLYDEALQIAAFANTLQRRHPKQQQQNHQPQPQQQLTAVHTVIAQIRNRQADLRRHLLQRLRRAVTVPECLETVTAVRRLNQIDLEERGGAAVGNLERTHAAMEYQLQIDFLEARDVWVDDGRSSAAGSNNNTTASSGMGGAGGSSSRPSLVQQQSGGGDEALLDAIERYRTRMFEVATQFNAIFRASSSSSSIAAVTAAATSAAAGDASATTTGGFAITASATTTLLSLWMARRVQRFTRLLQEQLVLQQQSASSLDAATLRDCLEASVFFATSLGRLGADFTPQLSNAIFEPVLVQIVTRHWKDGLAQLRETLTVCRDAGVAGPLTAADPEEEQQDNEQQQQQEQQPPQEGENLPPLDQPQPAPKKLLALPPLARLVNAVLLGLNELRRCLLPTVFSRLRRCLEDEILTGARQLLLTNERTVLVPGLRGEAAHLRSAAAALRDAFQHLAEPYLRGSLEAALGHREGAARHHRAVYDHLRQVADEKRRRRAELDASSPPAAEEEGAEGEKKEESKEEGIGTEGCAEEKAEGEEVESETVEGPGGEEQSPEEEAVPDSDAASKDD